MSFAENGTVVMRLVRPQMQVVTPLAGVVCLSRALRDQQIFHGSQHGVSYFMLKGKTDDGIKQVPAGNNLFDGLFNIPIERETEFGLFE